MLVLQLRRRLARKLLALARAVDAGSPDSPSTRSRDSAATWIDVSGAPAHWVDRIRDAGLLEPGAAGRWHFGGEPSGGGRGSRTAVAPAPMPAHGRGFDPSPSRTESAPATESIPESATRAHLESPTNESRPRWRANRGDPVPPTARRPAPITEVAQTAPTTARPASQGASPSTPDEPAQTEAPASHRPVSPDPDHTTGRLRLRVAPPTQPRQRAVDTRHAAAAAVEARMVGQHATEINDTTNTATAGSRADTDGMGNAPPEREVLTDSPRSLRDRSPRRRGSRVVPEPTPIEPFLRARTPEPDFFPTPRLQTGGVSPSIPPRSPIPAPWPDLPETAHTRVPEADVAFVERELDRRARWTAERNAV